MTLNRDFVRSLESIAPVRLSEPLLRHTTMGIGGPADAYVVAENADQLSSLTSLSLAAAVPVFLLGSGSNIVVGDDGIRGLVIENKARALEGPSPLPVSDPDNEEAASHWLRVESGHSFAALARQLAFDGYAGLEWACGIPGTIGGAVVYNAGAYGGSLGDVLHRVGVVGAEGETSFNAADLGLEYRSSAFTRGLMADRTVLWAEMNLWRGDRDSLTERVADFDQRRLKAQPRGRNAGSFFKNPAEGPAWKLLEGVGLRGHRIGGAEFSEKHCNFLINRGKAKAADVAALMSLAQSRVREHYGVELRAEVSLVGEGF